MFDYLQKFNNLPQNLRDSVSSPVAMAVISDLEKKYKIDLAATVMKVMAKIIPLADLSIYFVSDFALDQESAKKLTAELKERLFFSVANYLGYNPSYSSIVPKTVLAPAHLVGVEKIIKDSGVTFPGAELNTRFKSVLATYLKGVRSRIDTRLALNKEVISGGLGLDYKIIDKIFKIADEVIAGQTLPSGAHLSLPQEVKPEPVKSGLDKVRALYEKPGEARDIPYDLKAAISTGAIKKPSAPLNLPTPVESKEKLLEEPKKENIIVKPVEPTKPVNVEVKTSESPKVNITVNPVIPVTPVPPVVPISQKVVADLIPEEPKINRPPEKTGLLSKILGNESPKKEVTPVSKPEVKAPVAPIASVASLRAEAAAVSNKPTPKPVAAPVQNNEIRNIPKVMGPIEELFYLDIVNFRRLGSQPSEMAEKVESKIRLLEKDGYDKMIEGVMAWRSGLINSIYLKMGLEALSKGMGLKQCADNYQVAKDSRYLSWPEIEAIISLNSRLMF